MKKISDEKLIRYADTGYFSKEEYQYFQQCLAGDKVFAEKIQEVLMAELVSALPLELYERKNHKK